MNKQLEMTGSTHSLVSDVPFLNYSTSLAIQSAENKFCAFIVEATTGGGLHDNTMWIEYDSTDYLKCRHQHGQLSGTFTSQIYDKGSAARRMVYVLTEQTVVGVGTTWDSQIPTVLTGSTLLTNGNFSNWTLNEPDNWTETDAEADEEVSGQSGSGCKITTSADLGGIYQDISVTAGKWYRLDGYYKNTAGDEFCYATYDVTNSEWIDPEIGYKEEDASSWTAFSHLFKAPTGCSTIRLYFMGTSNGDIVYVDELVVKEIDESNSSTWSDIDITSNTWGGVFDVEAAPQVEIRLYYGDTSPPTSYIDKMEILSTIVKAQYYQVEISITDPTSEIFAYVKNYILEFCT